MSPSCVEGFGIPVLDAYILELNVLASNIPSHQEIASIPAVDRNLNLLGLNNVDSWISALREIDSDEKITTFLEQDNKNLGRMARNRIIDNYPIKRRKKAFEKCFIQNKL